MQAIETKSDFEKALAEERAAIFLWVDWSGQARMSEAAVRASMKALSGRPPITFFRVDLSSQKGELWNSIREWLKLEGEDYGRLTFGGYGTLVFVRNGHVVGGVFDPADNLIESPRARLSEALEALALCAKKRSLD